MHSVVDVQHIFGRQGFEKQQIARVVVGADGLGIAVDHDRLDADLAKRITCMATAVVKFDPLADPIRSTPEDHHPLLAWLLRRRFVFGLITAVVVRSVGLEFRCTCIDGLVRRSDSAGDPPGSYLLVVACEQCRQLPIGKTGLLGPPHLLDLQLAQTADFS